jgi:hypothetical protein
MGKPLKIIGISSSRYLSLPAAIIRANKLKPGDYLILEKFKIIRAELSEAEEPVATPAE